MGGEGDRARRAAARRTWPVRILPFGEEPADDLCARTTAEERLAMVWELTLEAWELAGMSIPDHARHETPGRVLLPGEEPDP